MDRQHGKVQRESDGVQRLLGLHNDERETQCVQDKELEKDAGMIQATNVLNVELAMHKELVRDVKQNSQ